MIRVELDDREVRRTLDELSRRLGDLTPAMHDIGQALVEAIRAHIRDGRDWQGRPFAPNKPATLARKKGAKPLVDSGRMADLSLHFRAGRDFVEVGSSAVQAAVLQFGARRGAFGKTRRGASIPWGNIPPRPFLPIEDGSRLPNDARALVLTLLTDHLADLNGQ